MIPATTLQAMRDAATRTLVDTATIERNTNNTFSLGQPGETWTNEATDVPARLATPSQALMQQYASLIGNMQAFVVSFEYNQSIQERDRVVILGKTLTVQALLNPESNSVLNRVLATKVG